MDNAPSEENANCAGSTTRRTVLKGVGGLTLGSLASGSFAGSRTFSGAAPTASYAPQATPPAASDRPNNVYFTVDNLGMGSLAATGAVSCLRLVLTHWRQSVIPARVTH